MRSATSKDGIQTLSFFSPKLAACFQLWLMYMVRVLAPVASISRDTMHSDGWEQGQEKHQSFLWHLQVWVQSLTEL